MKTETLDTNLSSKTICMNYDDQEPSTLEFKLVEEMISGYEKNQLESINEKMGFDDSRLIWFDLETLKKFIYHIETKTREIDPTILKENLGIHMYYSRYPDKSTWNDPFRKDLSHFLNNSITEQYARRHTIIMIPTLKKETKESSFNMDFNILDKNTYIHGLKYGFNISQNSSNYPVSVLGMGDSATINTESKTINAQNHGGLYPPHSSEGLAF